MIIAVPNDISNSFKVEYNLLMEDVTKPELRSSHRISFRVIHVLWVCIAAVGAMTMLASVVMLDNAAREGEFAPSDPVVSCYYNTPSSAATAARQLLPHDIHSHLCTHLNVAFARIVNKTIYLEDQQYVTLRDIVALRKTNPKLKILLSVGGSGNGRGFSDMVVDHASRKIFIKSIKALLRNYNLDGIDLDWEFPAIGNYNQALKLAVAKRERQHFSQLLREIRAEYIREKKNYLLTVAVAAPEIIVDAAYDVDQLDLYTDFVNVMTYDFNFYSGATPFTGLNSPLYARPEEELYLATLNINYTVHMYISKGLSPDKLVIGVPTYGHSYALVNSDNHGIGSPASGYGSLGSSGFVNYPDVCQFMKKHGVVINHVAGAEVPYLYSDREWVSFDYPQSVSSKAKFIKESGLRGAMVYSLNADDYEGVCEGDFGRNNTKFPLSQTLKDALVGFVKKDKN